MTHIDDEVAAFREQLDTTTVVAPGELEEAVRELLLALATAPTDSEAAKALLIFAGSNSADPVFRDTVSREALCRYAWFIASDVSPLEMKAMLDRFRHVALAWRVCQTAKGSEL